MLFGSIMPSAAENFSKYRNKQLLTDDIASAMLHGAPHADAFLNIGASVMTKTILCSRFLSPRSSACCRPAGASAAATFVSAIGSDQQQLHQRRHACRHLATAYAATTANGEITCSTRSAAR